MFPAIAMPSLWQLIGTQDLWPVPMRVFANRYRMMARVAMYGSVCNDVQGVLERMNRLLRTGDSAIFVSLPVTACGSKIMITQEYSYSEMSV